MFFSFKPPIKKHKVFLYLMLPIAPIKGQLLALLNK